MITQRLIELDNRIKIKIMGGNQQLHFHFDICNHKDKGTRTTQNHYKQFAKPK